MLRNILILLLLQITVIACSLTCNTDIYQDYRKYCGDGFYSYDIDGTRIYVDLPAEMSEVCGSFSPIDYLIVSRQLTVSDFMKQFGYDKTRVDTTKTIRNPDIFKDYLSFAGDKVFIEMYFSSDEKVKENQIGLTLYVNTNSPRPGPVSVFTLIIETRKPLTNSCWEYRNLSLCSFKVVSLTHHGSLL